MTTTTPDRTRTWDVTWSDTGEHPIVREVTPEEMGERGGWTPGPNAIPAHPERMRKARKPHHDVPARDYAELIGQSRITRDRSAIRDVYAHQDVGTDHLHHEAADWKDLAFRCEQLQTETAPRHRDVTAALMQAYARERDALVRGLPAAAPLPELHPARELAPERLDADAARRRKALAQAALGEREQPYDGPGPTVADHADVLDAAARAEPDGWVRSTRWTRALAWIGSRRKRGVV